MRTAEISRQTNETQIQVTLDLDGAGRHQISTGIGFLDHMLAHLAVHGLFDLTLQAAGDLHIDVHHTVEDVALKLGYSKTKTLQMHLRAVFGQTAGELRVSLSTEEALEAVTHRYFTPLAQATA